MKILQQLIDDKHIDSLWYDGLIAETERFELWAAGDIRIYHNDKDGSYLGMYDGKDRDDFGRLENDSDIQRIYDSPDYYVDMNNWFEIVEKGSDELGEVYGTYIEGIEMLKELEAS